MPDSLAAQIRARRPGAYDDLDDATLETKWRAKYGETIPDAPIEVERPDAPVVAMPGNDRTRPDTVAVGFNHEMAAQKIADWASTLPEAYQRPAAMLATFPADVLGSLVEMFSAPESIATGGGTRAGAEAMQTATSRALGVPTALARPAMRIVKAGAAGTQAGVSNLPIVGKPLRSGVKAAAKSWRGSAPAPPSAAPAPPAAPPPAPMASASPPAPVAAPAPVVRGGDTLALKAAERTPGQMSMASLVNDVGIAARRTGVKLTLPEAQELAAQVKATGRSPLDVVRGRGAPAAKLRLSAEEMTLAMQMAKAGKKPADIQAAITALRQSPLGQLPTTPEMDAAVTARNLTGRWR